MKILGNYERTNYWRIQFLKMRQVAGWCNGRHEIMNHRYIYDEIIVRIEKKNIYIGTLNIMLLKTTSPVT